MNSATLKPPSVAPQMLRPVPTDVEVRAYKRQLEMLAEDSKRACTADVSRPFTHLQDAVDRLLPFHVRCPLHTRPFDSCRILMEGHSKKAKQ